MIDVVVGRETEKAASSSTSSRDSASQRKKLEGWDGIRCVLRLYFALLRKFFFMDLVEYKTKEVSESYFHLGVLF